MSEHTSVPPRPTQPVAPAEPTQLPADTKPVPPTQAEKDRVFLEKLTEALKSDTSSDGGKARLVTHVKALVKEHEAKEK